MDVFVELQKIYDSEINFSISTFWDDGITVKLGDEMNGFIAETTKDTFVEAIAWLIQQVVEKYPKSVYAISKGV